MVAGRGAGDVFAASAAWLPRAWVGFNFIGSQQADIEFKPLRDERFVAAVVETGLGATAERRILRMLK